MFYDQEWSNKIVKNATENLVKSGKLSSEILSFDMNGKMSHNHENTQGCVFPLAIRAGKKLNQNPRDIAKVIVLEINLSDLNCPASVSGPGFIFIKAA
jgi:arginyl-tRNA synthetase